MFIKSFVIYLMILYAANFQDVSTLLKEVQQKYKESDNFSASFYRESAAGELSGKFYYAAGNKFRIELKDRIIVSDGKSIWNYDKNRNKVIVSNVEDDPGALSIDKYLFDYPSKCNVSIEHESGKPDIINLKPVDPDLNFESVSLSINSNKLIEKVRITDLMGNTFVFVLNDIKTNLDLDINLFSFTISGDIQIIDLR